ncbi:MAG: TetR/AcrR family transcriptional regulator [Pseudomonadota bacterium]
MAEDKSASETTSVSPFNRTVQHDAKRLAILSQAARLFNSKGSRATTLKDIAQNLGLTKTSLYYYVKTKEELIYQCYMAALAFHHSNLDTIEQQYTNPRERLAAYFHTFFENWLAAYEGRGSHIAALLEIASLKGAHREDVEEQYIALFKRLRQHLREGIESGSFRPVETIATTRAMLGSVDWAFSWLHKIPSDQVRDTARKAVDILARGLHGGSDEFHSTPAAVVESNEFPLQGFDRDQQNRLKQEAFYRTGTWLFNKQGFDGTSLDEIAEQLQVSKGAFYYHIRNKEDLLFNCYSRSLDIIEGIHRQASNSDVNGLQKIEQTFRRIFYFQNSNEGPLIRYNSITALPMERRRVILERTDANNARFGDFIREGMEDGSVREIDAFVAQNLIAGAVNASMELALWRRIDNLDDAAGDYFDVFLNGLVKKG